MDKLMHAMLTGETQFVKVQPVNMQVDQTIATE
jgi:hypothetical protein